MLDTDTKRRIDTARDILVGKVPDPKSQVEQITIAMIYKFMDDMDAESEELGGKRKFFTGDFAQYGWAKLMAPSLGGHAMLALYAEGITKMPENPGIPLLFREIFKNAYLPYRDPETLKAFLKIIDEFSYDHSERLGDAFEYLLSVLGSQGDAGQFRTPRHIIDFMVAVIDPKKTETVLDPACGTAGFLISSYKHILRANTDAKGHNTLTPDERGRLAKNFKGYDISPDMVRLSLVNLYLHGFTDPHIYEYDTLTSEERWNDFADVILANPPFMSPKGGIKPHKRFSIQAKRSEVLFVDYMAEHLTPAGRAGIIVPEGIIFQSQTAYKDLRKLLVENYLVAVVSLPAGCFNPYSGVKTSILILDKSLARQSDTIAFFKVENDGFGLGAQRRAIEKDDLPQVQAELEMYLQGLRTGQFSADHDRQHSAKGAPPSQQPAHDAHLSNNEGQPDCQQRHANNRTAHDAHLSNNEGQASAKGAPPSQPGATLQENAPQKEKGLKDCPIFGSGLQPSNDFPNPEPGTLSQAGMSCAVGAQFTCGLIVSKEKIAANGDYNLSGERYREGSADLGTFPRVTLSEVCGKIQYGLSVPLNTERVGFKTFRMNELVGGRCIDRGDMKCSDISPTEFEKYRLARGDILFNRTNSFEHVGRTGIFDLEGEYCFASYLIRLSDFSSKADPFYINALMNSENFQTGIKQFASRAIGQSNINATSLANYPIPLPPLEVQKEIVAEIEGYQKEIARLKEQIQEEGGKIQATLARIWGEEESDSANGAPPSQLGATPQENVRKMGKG